MTNTKSDNSISTQDIQKFRGQLLDWYDKHRRILPWRAEKGQKSNPYHVWLSEIMLQQTTVGAVGPYFMKFVQKWPAVQDLAAAPQDEIMNEWAGLGYYARARNLHACAKAVTQEHGGIFPQTQDELKKLPGIGDYTSAAIAAIAFNKPATVVDGNVERVMARIFAITDPMPAAKPSLKKLAASFFEGFTARPGDLAQAFMDLGSAVCIAKTPRCSLCPVIEHCEGKKQGIAETLPRKAIKAEKPQKSGYVYWISNDKKQILVHRRPQKGMLAGMLGLPTSEWVESSENRLPTPLDILNTQENSDIVTKKDMKIHHSFTHFDLTLHLKTLKTNETQAQSDEYYWSDINDIVPGNFPTLFKKALNLFLKEIQ